MANNYIQFSQTVDNLTDEEREWFEWALQDLTLLSAAELKEWQAAFPELSDEWESWPHFDFEFGNRELFIYSMDSGSGLENAVGLVGLFLKKFCPADSWGLEWAETCSKPRVGEFGGGWALVTAEGTTWGSTHEALCAAKEAP